MLDRLHKLLRRDTGRPPMPMIVGAPRSGTTLLRFMLDAHPALAIPPETGFVAACAQLKGRGESLRQRFLATVLNFPPDAPGWSDFQIAEEDFRARVSEIEPFTVAAGLRAFYQLYASRCGKPRCGDKTPMYCLHLAAIEKILPEAHFLHLIRDGRDTALSLRPMWFSPGGDIRTLATYWREAVTTARAQGARCRHYIEVRYEDLVLRPAEVLARVCDFLDLSFDGGMLNYYERAAKRLEEHRGRTRPDGTTVVTRQQRLQQQEQTTRPPNPSRVFAWRQAMSQAERAQFEVVAGDLLRELRYDAIGAVEDGTAELGSVRDGGN